MLILQNLLARGSTQWVKTKIAEGTENRGLRSKAYEATITSLKRDLVAKEHLPVTDHLCN